jgi:hypothetical protein
MPFQLVERAGNDRRETLLRNLSYDPKIMRRPPAQYF